MSINNKEMMLVNIYVYGLFGILKFLKFIFLYGGSVYLIFKFLWGVVF